MLLWHELNSLISLTPKWPVSCNNAYNDSIRETEAETLGADTTCRADAITSLAITHPSNNNEYISDTDVPSN